MKPAHVQLTLTFFPELLSEYPNESGFNGSKPDEDTSPSNISPNPPPIGPLGQHIQNERQSDMVNDYALFNDYKNSMSIFL